MSSRPFMQLYISDYLGDTQDLTCEQHGAYLLLLMAMWQRGGELPHEPSKLARICHVTPRVFRRLSADVMPFFEITDTAITHKRMTKELAKFDLKTEKRRNAGRRGGQATASKKKASAQANAQAMPQHPPESRDQSPDLSLTGEGARAVEQNISFTSNTSVILDPVSGIQGAQASQELSPVGQETGQGSMDPRNKSEDDGVGRVVPAHKQNLPKPSRARGPVKSRAPDRCYAAWNTIAATHGLSPVSGQGINFARDKQVLRRLADVGGEEDILLTAIKNVADNPFWLGQSRSDWRADFDWLFADVTRLFKSYEYKIAPQENESNTNGFPSTNTRSTAGAYARAASHLKPTAEQCYQSGLNGAAEAALLQIQRRKAEDAAGHG